MLTYRKIFNAITLKIGELGYDVFIDKIKQGFIEPCFFISIIPIDSSILTSNKNLKNIMISIRFYNVENKYELLDMLNTLENIFIRNIKIEERYITIKNNEGEIIEDEAGEYLSFLITLSFSDDIKIEKENVEFIGSININSKED